MQKMCEKCKKFSTTVAAGGACPWCARVPTPWWVPFTAVAIALGVVEKLDGLPDVGLFRSPGEEGQVGVVADGQPLIRDPNGAVFLIDIQTGRTLQ